MTGHRKIGVLLGGLSAERDVSIRAGEAILRALHDRPRRLPGLRRPTSTWSPRADAHRRRLPGAPALAGRLQPWDAGGRSTPAGVLARVWREQGEAKGSAGCTTSPAPGCHQADSGGTSSGHGSFGFPWCRAWPGGSSWASASRARAGALGAVEEGAAPTTTCWSSAFDGKEICGHPRRKRWARSRWPKGLYISQQVPAGHRLPPAARLSPELPFGAAARDAGPRRPGLRGATRVVLIVSERAARWCSR
jgi:hypothetical protein